MAVFKRLVTEYAFRPDWMKNKMVFLAGPRQIGKTFIAQEYLKHHSSSDLYYNWDLPEITHQYRQDPYFFESKAREAGLKKPTIVFDEIHKRSRWKNELKGIYDKFIQDFNFIITGSARLDLLRQTGESLAGRYFLFRVLPLGLQEYTGSFLYQWRFTQWKNLIEKLSATSQKPQDLKDLITLGGFPDPLSHGTIEYRRKWAMDYRKLILREDLRDLSRIQEIDRIETLWTLLPNKVGSPLSIKSLQEDLSASHEAIRTWLLNLEKLYSIFWIKPYSKKIIRSVKKEKKIYLMDWALHEDESRRFENFVMASLFRSICIWNDSGQGLFEIYYVKNVFGKEADFLITKEDKPWILGDIKFSATSIDPHLYKMSQWLGDIPIIQVVSTSGVFKTPTPRSLIVSADRLILLFP